MDIVNLMTSGDKAARSDPVQWHHGLRHQDLQTGGRHQGLLEGEPGQQAPQCPTIWSHLGPL